MKKTLSVGEFQVLLALWKCGSGATIDEVVAAHAERPRPTANQVRTVLSRCIAKGYATSTLDEGRESTRPAIGRPPSRFYSPAVTREEATDQEIERFVATYLDNDPEFVGRLGQFVKTWAKPKRAGSARTRRKRTPKKSS